jgi:hypothetical protein
MYSYSRALLYAITVWGITFLLTFFIYPSQPANLVLFTTLRMLILALLSVFFTVMYFREGEEHLLRDGFKLGAIWLATALLFDQGPFVLGPMHLSFLEYMKEIGISYLLCPIITLGAGFLLTADKSSVMDSEGPGYKSRQGSAPTR